MPLMLKTTPLPLSMDDDGVIRLSGTRVTLDTLVTAFHEGLTAEEIVAQYPSLDLGDTYAAIAYYLRNQPDVDAYVAKGNEAAEVVRRENEQRFAPDGIRSRLLNRRRTKG